MHKRIILASGNHFYHVAETGQNFSTAFIVDKNLNFIGGFLADEADRKLKSFSNLKNTTVETINNTVCIEIVNFLKFSEKLGSVSKLFLESRFLLVNDLDYCDGTSSLAESCDDRLDYYKAVGCKKLYKSRRHFPIWAFVANHVSIFGCENFRQTFFKGNELDPSKDDNVTGFSTRYSKHGFKAPAYYVKVLCSKTRV